MSELRPPCSDCGRPTVSRGQWHAHKDKRPEWKAAGVRQGSGRGLCRPCYIRHMRAGDLDLFDYARSQRPETCIVDGCDKPAHAIDRCSNHYRRFKAHGSDEPPRRPSPEERFWSKVDKSGECWIWTGYVNPSGYGQYVFRGRGRQVHHISYELTIGPVPDGMHLDHVKAWGCARTDCVNPAHLEPVTPAENNRRSNSRSAINLRRTECIAGHPFDDENTLYMRNGGRACRACRRRRQKGRVRRAA